MKNGFYALGTVFLILFASAGGWWMGKNGVFSASNTVLSTTAQKTYPLRRYSIDNLSEVFIPEGKIEVVEEIGSEPTFTAYLFKHEFSPDLDSENLKVVTGQVNIPDDGEAVNGEKYPLVVMLRGFVDQESYTTGDGTRRAAAAFARNGYITVAPDFLGFGGSDSESDKIFEARFQTYPTVLSILRSLDSIDSWDGENILFWGHSNGGHIALAILEITGEDYPTSLWAPVSASFPYSILYFTNEAEDKGKFLREELAEFEDSYDVDYYAIDGYLDQIKTEIVLHQGTADDAVPTFWSNALAQSLDKVDVDVSYYKYAGADHNLQPDWNTVISRDLNFFKNSILK